MPGNILPFSEYIPFRVDGEEPAYPGRSFLFFRPWDRRLFGGRRFGWHVLLEELADLLQAPIHADLAQGIDIDTEPFQVRMNARGGG